MTKKRSTKIENFRTLRVWVVEQGFGQIGVVLKKHYYIKKSSISFLGIKQNKFVMMSIEFDDP